MRALITGASVGIGRATALRLAQDGWDVAVHYRTHAAEAEAVAEEVRRAGRQGFTVGGDLAVAADVERIARTVLDRWPVLDGLVQNAGVYQRRPFDAIDPAQLEACFRANVFGPVELTRRLLPALEAAQPGRVVFVASILASDGSRHGAHYAAAKASLIGLGTSLAREFAPRIRVNVVTPGSIDTAILADDSAARRAEREQAIPLRRVGSPTDVADLISFLLGDRSAYITGAVVPVNGGLRMG